MEDAVVCHTAAVARAGCVAGCLDSFCQPVVLQLQVDSILLQVGAARGSNLGLQMACYSLICGFGESVGRLHRACAKGVVWLGQTDVLQGLHKQGARSYQQWTAIQAGASDIPASTLTQSEMLRRDWSRARCALL